jgi:hypothetical protein
MAYRVTLSSRDALAAVTLSGAVTWSDVAAAMCALFGHPGWFSSCSVLWDTRALTDLLVSEADLPAARGLMEALASARSSGRSAVLVESKREAALASTLVSLGPPTRREVRVFEEAADALQFLHRREMPAGMEVIATSE